MADQFKDIKRPVNWAWIFATAWQDSRNNRSRLLLFISSIIFGIAALVAIYSFGDNLKKGVDKQAAKLNGADVGIHAVRQPDTATLAFLHTLGADRSEQVSFTSMIQFPKGDGTRIARIRALKGAFPYYGGLETTPASAAVSFRTGKNALVDNTMMQKFGMHINDSIKVGNLTFLIVGLLNNVPGQTNLAARVTPIVYIPLQYLKATGLQQAGGLFDYAYYYKYPQGTDMAKIVATLGPKLDEVNLQYDTIDTRKESTGRTFADLTHYLSLLVFIALLLGCVGVASSVNIYIREKIAAIAIMRCLGAQAHETFLIYLVQIVAVGLIGSIAGSALGVLIQQALPFVFKDLLPITVTTDISWPAIGQGALLGTMISALFALLPLITIRKISPLNTLRISYEADTTRRDPLRWLVNLLIVGFIIAFAYIQLGNWQSSLYFTLGVFGAFLILVIIAKAFMLLARQVLRASWGYLWRQGFANLYRPNNQTVTLIVSIGLSTTFICTLYFVQRILVSQANFAANSNSANMVLFDIQPEQRQALDKLTAQWHIPIIQEGPILMMTVKTINGKADEGRGKGASKGQGSGHIFRNQYWATYQDALPPTEMVTGGKWVGHVDVGAPVLVSVEDRFAALMHLKVGDHVQFNIQGSLLNTIIGSTRAVEDNKFHTNFEWIFPTGVLEDAPQFFGMATHVPSKQVSAAYQQAVVKAFPNVSVVDLGQITNILDDLLDKVGLIVRSMGAFCIITGIVVLIASVRISKYQRMQESVLLRTMGASRKQILVISALEYFFLGALSALTGTLIALTGSWVLAKYGLNIPFNVSLLPPLGIFLGITVLTVAIGLLNSRGILNKSPLEVLRGDIQ